MQDSKVKQVELLLLEIYGIGPYTVKGIARKVLQINPNVSRNTLRSTLSQVSGLSDLTKSDLEYNPVKTIPRSIIDKIKQKYDLVIAGSYRRGLPYSQDIDVITDKPREYWSQFPDITKPIIWGEKKMMCYVLVDKKYYKIDFYFVRNNIGALLIHLTGSVTFNVFLRIRAQRLGLKLTEEGVYKNDQLIAYATEEDIFKSLDMPYIPPEKRTGWIHTDQLDKLRRGSRQRQHQR